MMIYVVELPERCLFAQNWTQGRRRRVSRGGRDPHTFESRGGRPPQKFGYFSIFFSLSVPIKILHFPTFSKHSCRNPRRS